MLKFLNHKQIIVMVIGLLLSTLVLAPMRADAEKGTKATSVSPLRKAEITIYEKGENYVVRGERCFEVTDTSVLTDMNNKRISLDQLPVPCVAEVEYRLRMDKDPCVVRLKIKKILRGARTK